MNSNEKSRKPEKKEEQPFDQEAWDNRWRLMAMAGGAVSEAQRLNVFDRLKRLVRKSK